MPNHIIFAALLAAASVAQAEDTAIAQLFRETGVDGTLVMESVKTGQRFVHNDARAKQAFVAASTFKVFNTLIAVEESAIGGADEPLRWDGTQYEIADWNRDQTLRTAFQVSCVWCYQALARQVGAETYAAYLRQAGYGQLREPFDVGSFWLDGALTISADQQVAFLKQVVERSLPFSANAYETLRFVMLTDVAPATACMRKPAGRPATNRLYTDLGWYVGYLVSAGDTWLFALNLDTRDAGDLPLRRQIALDALRIRAILPEA
jgi:beta-lactamase class D